MIKEREIGNEIRVYLNDASPCINIIPQSKRYRIHIVFKDLK